MDDLTTTTEAAIDVAADALRNAAWDLQREAANWQRMLDENAETMDYANNRENAVRRVEYLLKAACLLDDARRFMTA